ncbi:DUF3742 family protein [Yersinia enterocolitica]|uniref:DUF3742 family protein n=1 Tax=Yersinia enterocolitica TaxID=630 RepID=UPI003D01E397
MTNKASNQQDDIWAVIAKGLVEAVKMVFSIFAFFLTTNKTQDVDVKEEDGWREGHSGTGCYMGNTRIDDENMDK